jgi:hypothetical protein
VSDKIKLIEANLEGKARDFVPVGKLSTFKTLNKVKEYFAQAFADTRSWGQEFRKCRKKPDETLSQFGLRFRIAANNYLGPDSGRYDEECAEQLIECCKLEMIPNLRTLPTKGKKLREVLAWACNIEKRVKNQLAPPEKKIKKTSETLETLSLDEDGEVEQAKTPAKNKNQVGNPTKQIIESVKNVMKDQLDKAIKEQTCKLQEQIALIQTTKSIISRVTMAIRRAERTNDSFDVLPVLYQGIG